MPRTSTLTSVLDSRRICVTLRSTELPDHAMTFDLDCDATFSSVPSSACPYLEQWTGIRKHSTIQLEIKPACVNGNYFNASLASHNKSKSSWPNIELVSDKVELVLSFVSMAKSEVVGKCMKFCS